MNKNSPPIQLWLGSPSVLCAQVMSYLENFYGSDDRTKSLIADRLHHEITWLSPSKNSYTRDDLEPFFQKFSCEVAVGQKLFFIIEYADLLTPACANSLLKLLEEPPAGYYIILLAERKELILKTVISRCVVTDFLTHDLGMINEHEDFIQFFKKLDRLEMQAMAQKFDSCKYSEYQTRLLLDILYAYWFDVYCNDLKNTHSVALKKSEKMVNILSYSYDKLPMPGSAKMFWRNLFALMTL